MSKCGKVILKSVFGQSWGPGVLERWTFSKFRVSIRVKVRVRVRFSRCENLHFWWTRWCPKLGKWWKNCFWTKLGPQSVKKVDFFSKVRVSVRVRVRVWDGISRCENLHLGWTRWWPKLGKWWKKCFLTTFLATNCGKSGLFQKLRLALGFIELELRLAFQGIKIFTFDGRDDVQSLESDEKGVFAQSWAPKCGRGELFSKVRVSIRVKVRVRVSFLRCENLHFWWTRWCPKLGKWLKNCFWRKLELQSVEKVDFLKS